VKSKFVEYTHVLMLSKLDLHYDTKQAENVCFEAHNTSVNSGNQTWSCSPVVETRDGSTQTISSKQFIPRRWKLIFTWDRLFLLCVYVKVILFHWKTYSMKYGKSQKFTCPTDLKGGYILSNLLISVIYKSPVEIENIMFFEKKFLSKKWFWKCKFVQNFNFFILLIL